jgi:hypothetical protein
MELLLPSLSGDWVVLLIHTTQAPIKKPFQRATIGLVLETYYSLKKLFQGSGSGKLQELENVKFVLQRAFPVEMTRYTCLDDLLEELKVEVRQDIETYLPFAGLERHHIGPDSSYELHNRGNSRPNCTLVKPRPQRGKNSSWRINY